MPVRVPGEVKRLAPGSSGVTTELVQIGVQVAQRLADEFHPAVRPGQQVQDVTIN